MNRKIFRYSVVFLSLMGYHNSYGIAQEEAVANDEFSVAVESLKNPFSSPIAVKKKPPVVEKKKEVASKPVVVVPPPEIPVAQVAVNPPPLKITGLVWNSAKPQAIINGKVVAVGEDIDGSKLVAVRKSEIDVIFSGKMFTLNNNQPVKNDSKKSK